MDIKLKEINIYPKAIVGESSVGDPYLVIHALLDVSGDECFFQKVVSVYDIIDKLNTRDKNVKKENNY